MTRLESKVNQVHKANLDRNVDVVEYDQIKSQLGSSAYAMALDGRLYIENSKGDIVRVRVKGWRE